MNSDQAHEQAPLSSGNGEPESAGNDSKPVAPVQAASDNPSWSKKTVLLVDTDSHSRESRAKAMQTLGATVHCAATPGAARLRFGTGTYDLVLIDLGPDLDGAQLLADEIRAKKPRQLLAFLVGRPLFVAKSLKGKRSQSPQALPPSTPVPMQRTNRPAVNGMDFGQKIRDAEAEQLPDRT
jgi:CheY-like chemotaxis protein